MSGTPTVLYRVEEGVARITINRPERRNAMSWEVMRGLRRTIDAAADDHQVRVVVLAGAGDEAFCAGADLGKMTGGDDPGRGMLSVHEERGVLAEVFDALWRLGKPTVARVQGFALGGWLRAGAGMRSGRGLRTGAASGLPRLTWASGPT